MKRFDLDDVARRRARGEGPERVVIDSRDIRAGDLFFGLVGDRVDGGTFAREVLEAGAWGVVARPGHDPGDERFHPADDPTAALGALGRAWRRELGCQVIGITGSTGKTSTKEIAAAVIGPHRRTVASRANFNTEIGVPLEILATGPGTEVLILELAMRGAGQIAELTEIAEPDVGVIVNVGPVHLELLGSIEAIAAAKAELLAGLQHGATAVIPAGEPLLHPHRREDLQTVTFGPGGDVVETGFEATGASAETVGGGGRATISAEGETITLELPFSQAHQRLNLLAAAAAARAVGVAPGGRVDVRFAALRGERVELASGAVVVNDCYNANPMSMRAALDELALPAPARRVAVLGDMLELGPDEARFHTEIGAYAAQRGVDVLITVGPLAAHMLDEAGFDGPESYAVGTADEAAALAAELVQPQDTVLVKASRGVGLEVVAGALQARDDDRAAAPGDRGGAGER